VNYAVGHNIAGYLPEADVHVVATFEEAKAILIHDLLFAADHAESEDEGDELAGLAEDVNLWNRPDTAYANYRSGYMAYWIAETGEDVDDEGGE
jgi:hypothetical protein